jgi:hypothetical protein
MLVLALSAPAVAAPKADLVVVWAPGMRVAPVESAAKQAGAAFINQSPSPEAAAQTAQLVAKGIAAFEALELDQAWQFLEQARSETVRLGGAGLSRAQLSDLFLYRGLIKIQQGDTTSAWDELMAASTIEPTRELDPGRFSPKVRAEFDRARATVTAKPRANLTVKAPDGCTVNVDGVPAPGPVNVPVGSHWINASCTDRRPIGYKVELTSDVTVPIEPAPYLPPSDSDLLVQARTAGSRAFVSVEVRAGVATARLVGLDGRERDRKTVTVTGDLGPVADALTELLTPAPERHWYQSKWAWVSIGAVAAALIAIPVTAALSKDSGSPDATARPDFNGMGPWPQP